MTLQTVKDAAAKKSINTYDYNAILTAMGSLKRQGFEEVAKQLEPVAYELRDRIQGDQ